MELHICLPFNLNHLELWIKNSFNWRDHIFQKSYSKPPFITEPSLTESPNPQIPIRTLQYWQQIKIYIFGFLWVFMGFCGFLWVFVGFCGFLWVFMGFCGEKLIYFFKVGRMFGEVGWGIWWRWLLGNGIRMTPWSIEI